MEWTKNTPVKDFIYEPAERNVYASDSPQHNNVFANIFEPGGPPLTWYSAGETTDGKTCNKPGEVTCVETGTVEVTVKSIF